MCKRSAVWLVSLLLVSGVMACKGQMEPVVAGARPVDKTESAVATARVSGGDATTAPSPAVAGRQEVAEAPGQSSVLRVSNEEEQNAKLAPTIVDFRQFQDPQVQSVYQEASQIGSRLDQMYCYCHCKENEGHKTLLTCYQTAHASGCGICLHEAHLAYMDWQAGLPVSATIAKVNQLYNGGKPPDGGTGGM